MYILFFVLWNWHIPMPSSSDPPPSPAPSAASPGLGALSLSAQPVLGTRLPDGDSEPHRRTGKPAATLLWMAPLPPHLYPNPIMAAYSKPSRLQRGCAALLSWVLLAGAGLGVLRLGRRSPTESRELGQMRTVTVLVDTYREPELDARPPAGTGGGGSEVPSEEPPESVSASYDPRADLHPDLAETPRANPEAPPLDANLLPVRAVLYRNASVLGTPGVVGAGGIGGGGGQQKTGHLARWGEGSLLSGNSRGQTVGIDALDVIRQVIPTYPAAARSAKVDGEVLVDVVIDERGIPIEVLVVRADHILLIPTVLEVAPRWRFTPVLFGGRKGRANFRLCFRFILETS